MSTTLARRIRRIGLLPTTFKETTEKKTVTEIVNGKRVQKEVTAVVRTPVRNREELDAEFVAAEKKLITDEWRARRKSRTSKAA